MDTVMHCNVVQLILMYFSKFIIFKRYFVIETIQLFLENFTVWKEFWLNQNMNYGPKTPQTNIDRTKEYCKTYF